MEMYKLQYEASEPKVIEPEYLQEMQRDSSGTTKARLNNATAQKDDVGSFKVMHDHSNWRLLNVLSMDLDCMGALGIRGDTVWYKSDTEPEHSFSIPISQVRTAALKGHGEITLRLLSGKKYTFYGDQEIEQKFVSQIQTLSR